MGDSPDDYEIVDRSDLTEETENPRIPARDSVWPDDFEVGTEIGQGRSFVAFISRCREVFSVWLGRGRSSESGFEILDPDDRNDTFAAFPSGSEKIDSVTRSGSDDHLRVIETKVISTKISRAGESLPRDERLVSDTIRSENQVPIINGRESDNPKDTNWESPDRFGLNSDELPYDPGEVAIAENSLDGRQLTWREILFLPFAPLTWFISKFRKRTQSDDSTDDFAVASKRKVRRVSKQDSESPGGIPTSALNSASQAVNDTDELKIGTRSIVRKISEITSSELPELPPGQSDARDEYSVISASRIGDSAYRPGLVLPEDHSSGAAADENLQESLIPSVSSESHIDTTISQASSISDRLQKLLDRSDYARSTDANDENIEVGIPLESESNHTFTATKSASGLSRRFIIWFLTIPRRCLTSEGDLFDQRRLKVEPLLAAIPAVSVLISLILQISRVSVIDKLESNAAFLKDSQRFEKSGNTNAAMLAAVRSCSENATPESRYNVARLYTKSSDQVDLAHGLRLMKLLASPAGGNQADAHLFIANAILRQYELDPAANRNLFYRYLSELRAGFGSSPSRYDILELLAEGLIAIGEDRSLSGLLDPYLEYWPHGHFFLAQAAFGKGDDALQRSHAMAMVRHFRSTPAELELDQKYRFRFALALALAGEFPDAESFVRQMAESPQDAEIHKSLAEKIDLIRIITRIHEFPANSDQDIEVLGSLLEGEGLSQNYETAIKRQLIRKGPLRPALLKLCRNLYTTRKASFDADDYVFWASILRQNQQNDEARAFLENAVKIAPEHDVAANNLANLLYKLAPVDLKRALSLSESVLKRNPNEPMYLETRGQILARLGKNQEAIADLTKSLEAFPNVPEIHESLAGCYRRIGSSDLADAHQKRYEELRTRPESPTSNPSGTNES